MFPIREEPAHRSRWSWVIFWSRPGRSVTAERSFSPDAPLELHARDKRTGEILASVPLPAPGQYGMMTYMHEGKQYVVVQIGSIRTGFPGSLVALALP